MRLQFVCVLALSAAAALAAAENPFLGDWKLDPSKSDFTGETFKLEDAGNGKVRYSGGGQSFTMYTDGKEHPSLYGHMVSLKKIDDKTWERTTRFRGKTLSTTTMKVSDDGKTLTEDVKGTRPDGSSFNETDVFDKQGDGAGFFGTWKTKQVEGADQVMKITANGDDGLNLDLPMYKAKCALKMDGKDYPATGPTIPSGLTLAAKPNGDRSFEMTEKIKGKPTYKGTWSVSDDGKTLTTLGGPPATNETTKEVYDKE